MSSSHQRRRDLEATSDDDVGGGEGDEQVHETTPYGMSLISNEINMTNCYNHCKRFFEIHKCIHFKVLIAYWMMAGYLGDRVRSVEAAYRKGFDILFDLVHKDKILKLSDNGPGMVELAGSSTNANCRHRGGFCLEEKKNLGFADVLNSELRRIGKVVLCNDKDETLISIDPKSDTGGRYKYFAALNPTSSDSLKSLLQNVKSPSVLLLRGFDELSLPSDGFLLDTLRNLTILEISGSTRLTTIPFNTISQLIHLQCLNLSDLPIEEIPRSFFRNLDVLRWLILRGCYKLKVLDFSYFYLGKLEVLDLSHCTTLEKYEGPPSNVYYKSTDKAWVLDLSYTPLDPFQLISSVHQYTVRPWHLYLRGSKVEYLSSFENPFFVQLLDLSGSSCFTKLGEFFTNDMQYLVKLDLSWTKVKQLPSFANYNRLVVLSLRGLELDSLETLSSLPNQLVELDLSGLKIIRSSQLEFKLDFLQFLENLEILNLSQTSVTKLPDMSKLVRLKEVLLANCQHLKFVPHLEALTNLQTLDLSLPNDSFSGNRRLEIEAEVHLSSFPVPMSIKKLVLTNRSGVQKLFPLTTLGNLNLEILDLRGTDVMDWESKLEPRKPQERIPKPCEIHIVSVDDESSCQEANQRSSSDDVDKVFTMFISDIQKNLNSAVAQDQVEMLHHDLRYIQENYDRLKSSSGKELLQELLDAATNLSAADFAVDNVSIKQLLRMVVKLKLLVPRKQIDESEALEVNKQKKKKKKPLFKRSQSQENHVITVRGMHGMKPNLLSSYESLSAIQKNCLLCFSIFPYNEDKDKYTGHLKSLVIKKKILIYWWVGEGFIDPNYKENIDPEPTLNQNLPDKEMMTNDEMEAIEQFAATKGVEKPKTIEEIGKQILKVLVEKGFIEPVMKKGRESGSCCIHPFVHCFVIERAKEEGFFDFDQESGKLTPRFINSWRACLLKPHHSVPSSCKLWANYSTSPDKLESFKSVKTLFNVNETMIDIKQDWFSKMKNLTVLHLGIWHTESTDLIEVSDQKFMVDLKKTTQLRVLSLQGMPTITKLPDSVCCLSNLIILDLKECNYLEELPADIGSLKCLTYLDISNCPLLYELPKGISLLLKLEVLRGFLITVRKVARDPKQTKQCGLLCHTNNEACIFEDLLKLKRLRELSIIVSISKFPEDKDLKVFKEMKALFKLKILWKRSICSEDITSSAGQESSVRRSRWLNKLTCWKHQQCQSREEEEDEREENKHLDSIEKLELWCFPYENAPHWLNPRELKNLKRLYIMGGNLGKLHGSGTGESRWNVETLRLMYLHNLDIQWSEMKIIFPKLMYLQTVQCGRHDFFPCNAEGVWKTES